MTNSAEKYRLKALACENLARGATDDDIRAAWTEVAIEWHALASRMALEFGATGLRNQEGAAPQLAQ